MPIDVKYFAKNKDLAHFSKLGKNNNGNTLTFYFSQHFILFFIISL